MRYQMMPNDSLQPLTPGDALGRVCEIPMPFIGICNGFARAASLSPSGLRPKAEWTHCFDVSLSRLANLSPFPKRLKSSLSPGVAER
jgi:hypothetical protein